jgi:hypothetical protein
MFRLCRRCVVLCCDSHTSAHLPPYPLQTGLASDGSSSPLTVWDATVMRAFDFQFDSPQSIEGIDVLRYRPDRMRRRHRHRHCTPFQLLLITFSLFMLYGVCTLCCVVLCCVVLCCVVLCVVLLLPLFVVCSGDVQRHRPSVLRPWHPRPHQHVIDGAGAVRCAGAHLRLTPVLCAGQCGGAAAAVGCV